MEHRSSSAKSDRIVLNPLAMFPSKSDSLVGVFYQSDKQQIVKNFKSKKRWLDPETVDPKFGLEVMYCIFVCVRERNADRFNLCRSKVKRLVYGKLFVD